MPICTLGKWKSGRLSGTGEGFGRSVPDLSGNLAGFRVQKRIFAHLYPEKAEIWQNSGYRSRFLLICTRSEREIGRKPGTEKHFGCSVPVGDESPYGIYITHSVGKTGRECRYVRQVDVKTPQPIPAVS